MRHGRRDPDARGREDLASPPIGDGALQRLLDAEARSRSPGSRRRSCRSGEWRTSSPPPGDHVALRRHGFEAACVTAVSGSSPTQVPEAVVDDLGVGRDRGRRGERGAGAPCLNSSSRRRASHEDRADRSPGRRSRNPAASSRRCAAPLGDFGREPAMRSGLPPASRTAMPAAEVPVAAVFMADPGRHDGSGRPGRTDRAGARPSTRDAVVAVNTRSMPFRNEYDARAPSTPSISAPSARTVELPRQHGSHSHSPSFAPSAASTSRC